MLKRVFPPLNVALQSMNFDGGRTITAQPGAYVDASLSDADRLGANGWLQGDYVGPTSGRPAISTSTDWAQFSTAGPGFKYLDSTLGIVLICDGKNWRNVATGSVA